MKKRDNKVRSLWSALLRLLRQPTGATTVLFALTFPTMWLFYSLGIDSSRLLASQARLVDGLNQGVFAVAMTDNRHKGTNQQNVNTKLIKEYLSYYLPGTQVSDKDITVSISENNAPEKQTGGSRSVNSVEYQATAEVQMSPIFKFASGGFDDNIRLRADSSAGRVRITMQVSSTPTDYVFVLDFSGSMTSSSAEPGKSRIQLLKDVVKEFANAVLTENDKNRIAFVPFANGVPVRLADKHPAGGEQTGCSFVAKLKPAYAGVDLTFWYNKAYYAIDRTEENRRRYLIEKYLQDYYKDFISLATGLSLDQMTEKGWCVKNATYDSNEWTAINGYGRTQYSCSFNPKARLSDPQLNQAQFKQQSPYMKALVNSANNNYGTLLNDQTLDYEATLAGDYMFRDDSVTTFPVFYGTNKPHNMCRYAFNRGGQATSDMLKTAFPDYYLIELTADKKVIAEFQRMKPEGNTDSSSALLRAVPVLAKGTNTRKVMIIVSDGEDNGSRGSGPQAVTYKLHTQYNICNKIREGLLQYPEGTPTTQSDIYYVSVVQAADRRKFWEQYCTGDKKAFIATNYKSLIETLLGIARERRVDYINKDEEK
ncbi:MAG: hypothetical protein ACRC5A_10065 [Enterobacteriaceae bacterium]